MPNTVYSKDDATVTIFEDRVEWYWDNGSDGEGTESFALEGAVRELEMAGREDLAALVAEALEEI